MLARDHSRKSEVSEDPVSIHPHSIQSYLQQSIINEVAEPHSLDDTRFSEWFHLNQKMSQQRISATTRLLYCSQADDQIGANLSQT